MLNKKKALHLLDEPFFVVTLECLFCRIGVYHSFFVLNSHSVLEVVAFFDRTLLLFANTTKKNDFNLPLKFI